MEISHLEILSPQKEEKRNNKTKKTNKINKPRTLQKTACVKVRSAMTLTADLLVSL